jgi:ectoine hydroxylase-related dioxygenase (phytanoyl-CoA dioxygenase family)
MSNAAHDRVTARSSRVWLTPEQCRLSDFVAGLNVQTMLADYPLAQKVESNVLVYDGDRARAAALIPATRKALLAEWAEALMQGPGIIVLSKAFADVTPVDEATRVFQSLIQAQQLAGTGGSDHFAKPGANDRIWNALEKLCLYDPAVFAAYYSNDIIAMVSEAWLGVDYQMTSQVNVVNPGGAAQSAHRDYHLGFQTPEKMTRFPAHVHRLSPALTLQGAVAHCDMPLETGPTLYLPYSQQYEPGYLAMGNPAFSDYFDRHHVQLPLTKGDAVFFNPALFHAAGTNRSKDVRRMANLLQVSSAYGRAMESVDRTRMSAALYPALRAMLARGDLTASGCANAIAACAEAYAFPTNLDRNPPVGGLAPQSQQDLMRQAIHEAWQDDIFGDALKRQAWCNLTGEENP